MKTTLILNPMNPWLSSHSVRRRLVKYWEARQQQGQTDLRSPLMTAKIECTNVAYDDEEDYCQFTFSR
jgi:hypothetical protein